MEDYSGKTLVVYDSKVIDVTDFVQVHPGGAGVLKRNDHKDITEAFRRIGHSTAAETMMTRMVVCNLEEWKVKYGNDFNSPQEGDDLEQQYNHTSVTEQLESIVSCEYHCKRRKEMLMAHPEIEKLYEPSCVPLIYMPICFFSFMGVAYLVGQQQLFDSLLYNGLALFAASWIVLPFCAFGLNNASHEICHGNTWLPSSAAQSYVLSKVPNNLIGFFSYMTALATKSCLLLNGIVTLNHFLFYYYSFSHISHHNALGSGVDRGHAFRTLYFKFSLSSEDNANEEKRWAVDGDLFGLYPASRVMQSDNLVDSLFGEPRKGTKFALGTCPCHCVGETRGPFMRAVIKFVGLNVLFVVLRILGEVWLIFNTLVFTPILLCGCVRRPFDMDMLVSGLFTLAGHVLWIIFAGPYGWLAVYLSSFSQPTHMPASIYFGYYTSLHAAHLMEKRHLQQPSLQTENPSKDPITKQPGRTNGMAMGISQSASVSDQTYEAHCHGLSCPAEEDKQDPGIIIREANSGSNRENNSDSNGEGSRPVNDNNGNGIDNDDNNGNGNGNDDNNDNDNDDDSPSTATSPNTTACQLSCSNYHPLMRFITFDQSLHLEHHDFPSIPCHRLGSLRHIAKRWYAQDETLHRDRNGRSQVYACEEAREDGGRSNRVAGHLDSADYRVRRYDSFWKPWVDFLTADEPHSYGSCG